MINRHQKMTPTSLIFILSVMYGFLPPLPHANAVSSLADASDLISDSDISATNITHIFNFATITSLIATDYIEVQFPANFTSVEEGNIVCPVGFNASLVGNYARCTATGALAASSTSITVYGITNPNTANSYSIPIITANSSDTVKDRITVKVSIIDDVTVSAVVNATLTFAIAGKNAGTSVSGVTCSATSTATTTAFGILSTSASSTVCQNLSVITNATDGFVVTVEQNDELTSMSGGNINSFNNAADNTGVSTTTSVWQAPTGILDSYNTYGHMGITSDDADLNSLGGYNDFTGAKYSGLNNTDPLVIMHHDGPADGITVSKGATNIAYTAEVTSLQEAGDYENTLTYICTPTY